MDMAAGASVIANHGVKPGVTPVAKVLDADQKVLEDNTGLYSPEGWGRAAVLAYTRHMADCIVVEDNFGGDMVRSVLQGVMIDGQHVGNSVKIRKVTASRGKAVRAEPIAAMYERGLVHHVGNFPQLEEELKRKLRHDRKARHVEVCRRAVAAMDEYLGAHATEV